MSTPQFLTVEQTMRAIMLLYAADVPCCILGGVGIGKTSAVKQVHAKMAWEYAQQNPEDEFGLWTTCLTLLRPEDIGGFPREKNGGIDFLMPNNVLPYDSEQPGIIFADEYDRASIDVQNAFNYVILGKEYHGHTISPNAYVILAGNGSSDIYTSQMSAATRNRVCFLYTSPTAAGDKEEWAEWARGEGLDSRVIAAGSTNSNDDHEKKKEFETLAIPTPRSMQYASDILQAADTMNIQTSDILWQCISGVVGYEAAIEIQHRKEECLVVKDAITTIKRFLTGNTPDKTQTLNEVNELIKTVKDFNRGNQLQLVENINAYARKNISLARKKTISDNLLIPICILTYGLESTIRNHLFDELTTFRPAVHNTYLRTTEKYITKGPLTT